MVSRKWGGTGRRDEGVKGRREGRTKGGKDKGREASKVGGK